MFKRVCADEFQLNKNGKIFVPIFWKFFNITKLFEKITKHLEKIDWFAFTYCVLINDDESHYVQTNQ